MDFFISRTDTIECYEITKCDWGNKGSIAKYMLTGNAGRRNVDEDTQGGPEQ